MEKKIVFGSPEYKDFMYNPANAYNCSECPENEEREGSLPCGQQNCWVCVHCNR